MRGCTFIKSKLNTYDILTMHLFLSLVVLIFRDCVTNTKTLLNISFNNFAHKDTVLNNVIEPMKCVCKGSS